MLQADASTQLTSTNNGGEQAVYITDQYQVGLQYAAGSQMGKPDWRDSETLVPTSSVPTYPITPRSPPMT